MNDNQSRRAFLRTSAGAAAVAVLGPRAVFGQSVSGDEVRIGAIVPSSGPFAEWGRTNTVTLRMLEEQVNNAGGIGGARLKITIYDDAAEPAQSANALRKLASDDGVLAVAGPLTSSSCEVAFPVANRLGIVTTSQASSKPGVAANNRPWAFRNTVNEAILADTSVPYLKEAYGASSAGIIYDANDAVSTAIGTKIMPKVMQDNGVEVVNADDPLSFHTGDLDVSAQVTTLKSMNPDAVVVGADYSQAVTVMREMKRQGLTVPVIGGTPLISSAILQAAPEIPIVAPATYYAGMEGKRVEAFTNSLRPRLRAESGLPDDIEPSMYDAHIHEIVRMYIDAVRDRGVKAESGTLTADRTRIRDHMASIKEFPGLAGPIGFNQDGDAVKTFYVLVGEGGSWREEVRGCSSSDMQSC